MVAYCHKHVDRHTDRQLRRVIEFDPKVAEVRIEPFTRPVLKQSFSMHFRSHSDHGTAEQLIGEAVAADGRFLPHRDPHRVIFIDLCSNSQPRGICEAE